MNKISKKAIIIDLDGTICNLTHRLHYIQNGNRDYDAFHEECAYDEPIDDIIAVVQSLRDRFGKDAIVFVTGRGEQCREATINWLEHYVGDFGALYMRQLNDFRKDVIIKEEILEDMVEDGYDPWLALDDREDIVRLWRDNGIKTLHCSDWQNNSKPFRQPTLHILVGPSGAGKSQYANDHFPAQWIISSDDVRQDMLGDWKDQTKNEQVFKAFHKLIKARLESGLDVVADATHLRRKDRLAVTELARGDKVVYHVINRPVEDKLRTGGWRLGVEGLIEKHEQRFKSQLKDILKGDNLPNVTVEDLR